MTQIVATAVYDRMKVFASHLYYLLKRSERLNAHSQINVQLQKPVSTVLYFQFNIIIMKVDKPDIHTGSGGITHQELAHEQFTVMRARTM